MFTLSSASSRCRLRAGPRCALLGGLLAVLVVLGVLAMHTMQVQTAVAASDPAQGASAPAAHTTGSPGVVHSGDGDAAPVAGVGMHHADGTAGTTGGSSTHGGAAGAAGDLDCEGCPAAHLGLAMTCLVALLLVLFVLTPPRLLRVSTGQRPRAGPLPGLVRHVVPRPPSLQELCISRT
ncbi:hypothetical protein [Citricoccus sp.]|uniref:hypothetical protein n=1 Tax=Citricoccus sp. TaxID=1978372 RepID=UPI0028BEA20E|nr:hypothetical protein [Citricoccus sp.]